MSFDLKEALERITQLESLASAQSRQAQRGTTVVAKTRRASSTSVTNVTTAPVTEGLVLIPPGAGQILIASGDSTASADNGLAPDYVPTGCTMALIRFEAQCAGLNTGIELKTRPTGTTDWTRVLYIFPLDSTSAACTNTNDAWVLMNSDSSFEYEADVFIATTCPWTITLVGYWG